MTILKNPSLKLILGLLFIVFMVMALSYDNIEKIVRPEFCKACHMMKPEYFSLKASSHEKAACIACHDFSEFTKKMSGLKKIFYAVTGLYVTPIKILSAIPDSKCEVCHNPPKRTITPSKDLLIPHSVHKQKKVNCAECHRGVAHGNIADRKVIYKTDYEKWDLTLAKSIMTDDETRPLMDSCMNCHKVRGGPLNCKACHKTAMLPDNHKTAEFKSGQHGKMAYEQISGCNKCHGYMSKKEVTGFEELSLVDSVVKRYTETSIISLQSEPSRKIGAEYSKQNTFCRSCHRKRPTSHIPGFANNHGGIAKKDKNKCFICHDPQSKSNSASGKSCSSCHPSTHSKDWQWRQSHPVPLGDKPKVVESCYECHTRLTCAKCHGIK